VFDQIPTFPLETPAFRAVEMMPVRAQGQNLIMIRDPLNLIEGSALLVPDPLLLVFMEMADGKTTLGEMAQRVTMMSGQIISVGLFEKMVQQLDEALLLQSDRFAAALRKKYEEWASSPTRPYKVFRVPAADRLKMLKELGDEFRRHRMSSISPPVRMELPAGSVAGILAPHIDYQRGGEAYAWAYRALKECGTGARTFIVLGTSHRPSQSRFIATRKHFETPLGTVENDHEVLDALATAYGEDLYAEEFLHMEETTIELQAMYLRHLFGDDTIKIVPILTAPIDDLLEEDGTPRATDPQVEQFIAALRTVLDKYGDSVALIGAVDFSHCGPEFGDEQPNTPERAKEIERDDRLMLEKVEKLDGQGFFDSFRPDQNERKVCSISATYVAVEAMKGRASAKMLTYQQSSTNEQQTLVSFGAVAFLKPGMEAKPVSRIILATR